MCYKKCIIAPSDLALVGLRAVRAPAHARSHTMPQRRALSDRQRKFVGEYLIHLNATKAAVRAGYSPRSAADIGHALRHHPAVMSALAAAMAERERRTGVSADRIVTELARIAFADIRSFADWGENGAELSLRAAAELSADDAAAIAEIYGPGKAGGRPKLKLHDKRAALELLARHVGLIGPRRESPTPPRPAGPELPAREILRRKLAAMAREKDSEGGA
jgi:phage terminase small subunit